VVVTSAIAGEGKSTVSCNVAAALAQRGRKVLLVDADMRCSSIHGRLDAKRGLGSMGYQPPTDYVRYQPVAELPNLNVVPAGFPPAGTSAEILASPQMEELVATWRVEFDHVIIDTPPILPFADALFLSAMSDGVLLVTRSQVSRGKAVLRARDMLTKSGVEILGFVLNAVKGSEFFYAYPAGYRADSGVSPPSETTPEKATEPL
jgi:capsular exopolysaccharide synthesis family protein